MPGQLILRGPHHIMTPKASVEDPCEGLDEGNNGSGVLNQTLCKMKDPTAQT